jgi:exopolyphosphatase/guanosine-5'-triphosphate,3'-diphosphate pyrophosphatase
MIIGAIDVGSNSVKLTVGPADGRKRRPLAVQSAITRLGGGVDRTGRVSRAAQDRTIKLLRRYRRVCAELGVDRIVAAGTEALRIASNGAAFAKRCRKEAGIPLRILSGLEEARLAFRGATKGRRERVVSAIDIGGGSTEIMVGIPGALRTAVSLPLGAVRLTEAHVKSDPPALAERLGMFEEVHKGMKKIPGPLRRAMGRSGVFLGIGGTCVNVARMARPKGSPEGRRVPLEELEALLDRLAEMPLAKRKRVRGIDPDRADIILAGARILVETMKALGLATYTATVHGLRRGLMLQAAGL